MPPSKAGTTAAQSGTSTEMKIEEPSYSGPSAMWEKGETFPTTEQSLGASEEEKDALEN
jgi:glycogenin glucosyltransferase